MRSSPQHGILWRDIPLWIISIRTTTHNTSTGHLLSLQRLRSSRIVRDFLPGISLTQITSRLDWFQGSFGIDYSAICEGRRSGGTFKRRFDGENGPEYRKNNPGSYQHYMKVLKTEKPHRPYRHFKKNQLVKKQNYLVKKNQLVKK